MPIPQLDTLAVGAPITRLGVSLFPVYLATNDLPSIATGDASGLVVDELDQTSVRALRVRNPGDRPVLVVEGEHFLGGKQNRALNATVLVPARTELEIPVSCLEQGRWGQRQEYRRDDAFAAAPVRAAQHAGVARSMGQSGSREGDQSAVWHAVDRMLARTEVNSSTAAAADVRRQAHRREPSRAATVEQLAACGPLPGQCGIVVTHGSWVQPWTCSARRTSSPPTGPRWSVPTCSNRPSCRDARPPRAYWISRDASRRRRDGKRQEWATASSTAWPTGDSSARP